MRQNQLRQKNWLLAGLWVFCIYSTLYAVRSVCQFLKQHIPFAFFTNFLIILILAILTFYIITKVHPRRLLSYLLLIVILGCYAVGLFIIPYPEEKWHFMEYGILAYLIFKACRVDFQEGISYFLSLLLTTLIGWGDEGIQGLLPNRYYDIRDVVINGISGVLSLLFVFVTRYEQGKSDEQNISL